MLKLIKNPRSPEIFIDVQPKGQLFTKSFLIAFMIAISLHIIGASILSIRDFKIFDSSPVIPPVSVNVDLYEEFGTDYSILALIDEDQKIPRLALAPKISIPKFPEISNLNLIHEFEYVKEKNLPFHPFLSLENEMIEDLFRKNEEKERPMPPSSFFLISGLPAEKNPPHIPQEFYERVSQIKNTTEERVVFSFQLYNPIGKIIWFDLKEGSKSPYLSLIEDILKVMEFEKSQDLFISGEIEFLFFQNF